MGIDWRESVSVAASLRWVLLTSAAVAAGVVLHLRGQRALRRARAEADRADLAEAAAAAVQRQLGSEVLALREELERAAEAQAEDRRRFADTLQAAEVEAVRRVQLLARTMLATPYRVEEEKRNAVARVNLRERYAVLRRRAEEVVRRQPHAVAFSSLLDRDLPSRSVAALSQSWHSLTAPDASRQFQSAIDRITSVQHGELWLLLVRLEADARASYDPELVRRRTMSSEPTGLPTGGTQQPSAHHWTGRRELKSYYEKDSSPD